MASQLTSFSCLGILSEIAASSTLRKISSGACVTHGTVLHRLNARQSDNFIEFLRNALSQPPESILSSFRIAKRLGKREYLFRLWLSITQFDATVHCDLTHGHVQYSTKTKCPAV